MKRYVFLFYFLSHFINAQDIQVPYRSYSVKNGFITDNIYSVFRDSKGLMWYGTDNGILQFDGTTFKTFTTQDGLPDNEIFNFYEDLDGRIWFASFNGNLGYYFQGKCFNQTNTSSLNNDNHLSFISIIETQRDSSLLFLYFDSKSIIEIKDNHLSRKTFNYNNQLLGNLVYVSKTSPTDYIGYTPKAKLFFTDTNLTHIDQEQFISRLYYSRKVYTKQGDSLFVITNGELKFVRRIMKHQLNTNNYFLDDNGYLFEGTQVGIFIYNATSEVPIIQLFKDCIVSSINKDIEGNYWISTLNKGVFYLPKGFLNIKYTAFPQLNKINTLSVHGDQTILFTEDNKLWRTDQSGEITQISGYSTLEDYKIRPVKRPIYIDSTTIMLGGNNIVYFNATELNPKLKTVIPRNLKHVYAKSLVFLSDTLYFSNNKQLNKVIRFKEEAYHTSFAPSDQQRIFAIALNGNQIYISTLKTVYKLEQDTLIPVESFVNTPFRKFRFFQGVLVGITHDYQLIVGFPTLNENQFRIQTILEDCSWMDMNYIFHSNVLLRSDKGYYILNISKDTATLTPSENVLLPSFPQEIVCDSPYVYFLSVDNTITRIHNAEVLSIPYPPKMIVRSFMVDGNYFNFNLPIKLKKNAASNIVIEFTGVGFDRKKIAYQYSINDGPWIDVEENRILFVDPRPGTYKVNIRCRSDSSAFSDPAVIDFVIAPPWYNHVLFYMAIAFLLIVLIFLVGKYLLKRNARLKELKHQEELRFLTSEFKSLNALMNPHFIFNSLNNIQYLINDDNKVLANQYLSVFSKLIRQNMENINNDLISLDKEMNLVENYLQLEKLRFKERLNFSIELSDDVDISSILVPPLLIQPLVENAIKHGILPNDNKPGNIKIDISEQGEYIKISILDNGVGLDKSSTHKGLQQSISNIKSRLKQLELIHGKVFRLELKSMINASGMIEGAESTITILQ